MMSWRRALSMVAVALLCALRPSAGAAAAAPRLFGSRAAATNGPSAGSASGLGLGVVRSRPVRLNPQALPGSDGAGTLPRIGQSIVLNLFPGVSVRASLARATRIARGMTWSGHIEGEPLSDVILTVYDGVLTGSVVWPAGTYRISFDGTGPVVEQLDHSQFPEGKCFEEVEAEAGPAARPDAGASTNADDGSLIDVLVVYTAAARAAAGGTPAIGSLVNTAVTETNTGYQNSGVIQRLRLVATAEIAFTENPGNIQADLSSIAANASVQAMRNTYRADEVVLIGEGYGTGSGACGVAYLMSGNNPGFASNAYAVVDRTCATGYYSFGHELGHNMGLNHARADPVGTGAFNYSYGYKNPSNLFRTVMAYNCPNSQGCPRVLYFSNPGVLYGGSPTGISEALASSANNALSLNGTRVTVANFRASPATLSLATPNGGESRPAGSTWPIQWTATGLSASATLTLQYTNGSVTNTIASGLPRATTSYNWTLPNTQGTNWRVVVCSLVGGVCEAQDQSDAPFSIVAAVSTPAARGDLGGDSKPDILWHDQSAGALRLWSMNGTLKTAIADLNPARVSDLQWQVRALADFNADGRNDLLWQHLGSGDLSLWLMNGATAVASTSPTPGNRGGTAWQVRGAADVSGDGKPDILWHNQTTGAVQIWTMSALAQTGTLSVGTQVDTRWAIRGFADLDGDGEADILWHHQDTGALSLWRLNHGSFVATTNLAPAGQPDLEWRPAQVADFDGDGRNDVLWQNERTRQLYVWAMNGTALQSTLWVLGWQRGVTVVSRRSSGAWQVAPR
jgi:hypothetical protein